MYVAITHIFSHNWYDLPEKFHLSWQTLHLTARNEQPVCIMLCQNGYFDLLSNKPTGLASSRLIKHELIYIQWYEHKLKQLRNFPFLVDPGIYKHLSESHHLVSWSPFWNKDKVILTLFCDIVNIAHKPLLSGGSMRVRRGNSSSRVTLSSVPSAASHAYRSDSGEGIYSRVITAALLAKCLP